MAEATTQDLENLKRDASDFATFVNGSEAEIVTPRQGDPYKTVRGAMVALDDAIVNSVGVVAETTLANLNARATALGFGADDAGRVGRVWNDGTPANNGEYRWTGSAWSYLGKYEVKIGDLISLLTEGVDAKIMTALERAKLQDFITVTLGGVTFTEKEGWFIANISNDGMEFNHFGFKRFKGGSLILTDAEGWEQFESNSQQVAKPATIARPWMGAITDTSIAFAADVEGDGTGVVEIEVSTDQYFTNIVATTLPKVGKATERSPGVNWRSINQVVDGLTPDTDHWARFTVDGVVSDDVLTFKTAPAPGVGAAYRFALMSCTLIYPDTDCQVHRAIASFDPLFVVHTGDLQYTDISVDDVRIQRSQNTRRYRNNADVKALLAKAPFFYVTDDHDTANNDCYWEKTFTSGATFEQIARNTRKAWRETTPLDPRMFPQIQAGELDPDKMLETQQFDIANTRHLLLDTRSQNSRTNATILGNDLWAPYWNQLAWLKSALVQAGTDGISRVFLHVPIGWVDGGEVQNYFSAERTAISDYIRDTPGIPPVTITTGDFHVLGVDDGTNSDYATGGGLATGVIMSSAAHQTTIPAVSPFSWLGVDTKESLSAGVYAQYFAIIDVAANGEWTVNFYGGPYTDTTPTLLGTYALSDSMAAIEFASASMSAAASSTANVPVKHNWVSRAGVPSANWTTNNGQSGTVTFKPNSKKTTIPVVVPASGSITVTLSAPTNATIGAASTFTLTAS